MLIEQAVEEGIAGSPAGFADVGKRGQLAAACGSSEGRLPDTEGPLLCLPGADVIAEVIKRESEPTDGCGAGSDDLPRLDRQRVRVWLYRVYERLASAPHLL